MHQADAPLVWQMEECFVDEDAFVVHQKRATAAVEPHFSISEGEVAES